ncbi:pilus assembly PilX family protein [Shewanella aestuarii]|uniref:Pilus assembly PilX N-terminal domain-containing protein n=1 Tax=Shewanella aestuarii TaxID=1028752 RepID=A0ABT0L054_9GAMM|nr:pilus assembly PilX N-terminal domain-containing protein [Shewanella aestuarii]MCL1117060.1 pilus assembly PilX N-terminal domain-containing protein [Shewanella aestuarii]
MQKQQGIVLFFSLIILVIMTVIGVALAVNATQSLRMAGAGSERIEAMLAAQGAQDKVIIANEGETLANMAAVSVQNDLALGVTNTMTPLVNYDVNCARDPEATDPSVIQCRRVEISSAAAFGRSQLGRVTVVSGIEQEVLTGS